MTEQTTTVPSATGVRRSPPITSERLLTLLCLVVISVALLSSVLLPLWSMFSKSFLNNSGQFVGLANYVEYFSSSGLINSISNSVSVAASTMIISCVMAFVFAYALTRSCMPGKKFFQAVATIPILAPSLLPAIALIYLFGNQGLLKSWLLGESIYGPIGIMLGMVFYIFPHVLMIMKTALSAADGRLYDAARAFGASPVRIFFTVTLPGARYGLISAAFVAFTLTITDFGVPKVIGGHFSVLATDIYKQVVGQQNFSIGAIVGMILLIPAAVSFAVDRHVRKKQVALLSAQAQHYHPKPDRLRDTLLFAFCCLITVFLVGIIGTAAFASLVTYWPYNMSLTLNHYDFNAVNPDGWASFYNSLLMATGTAVFGTLLIFLGGYFVEKSTGFEKLRGLVHMLAMVPMAVPGMVLGLSYVFFFSTPVNPLHPIYGTMIILVLSSVVHFYTVSHITVVTALKAIDREFESVSASLKVPFYRTLWRVHVPICLPAISDVAMYLFVNAMTTVSAVVFIYAPDTKLASIAVLNMDDVGDQAPAAAMAMVIVATSVCVKLGHVLLMRWLNRSAMAWKVRKS